MSSFYERVLYELRERYKVHQSRVIGGKISYEEYKSYTGMMMGLMEAEDALKDAYKAIFKNEGNEDERQKA